LVLLFLFLLYASLHHVNSDEQEDYSTEDWWTKISPIKVIVAVGGPNYKRIPKNGEEFNN
jgi:hypothetical protein